jgi:hypothetical protein
MPTSSSLGHQSPVLIQRDQIIRYGHAPCREMLALPTIIARGIEVPESRNQAIGMHLWGAPFRAITARLSVNANTAKKIYY